jgi:hypothetical protein
MDPNKLMDNLLKYHSDVAGPIKDLSEYFHVVHDRNNHE